MGRGARSPGSGVFPSLKGPHKRPRLFVSNPRERLEGHKLAFRGLFVGSSAFLALQGPTESPEGASKKEACREEEGEGELEGYSSAAGAKFQGRRKRE